VGPPCLDIHVCTRYIYHGGVEDITFASLIFSARASGADGLREGFLCSPDRDWVFDPSSTKSLRIRISCVIRGSRAIARDFAECYLRYLLPSESVLGLRLSINGTTDLFKVDFFSIALVRVCWSTGNILNRRVVPMREWADE
jgi:hypothetical protein